MTPEQAENVRGLYLALEFVNGLAIDAKITARGLDPRYVTEALRLKVTTMMEEHGLPDGSEDRLEEYLHWSKTDGLHPQGRA